MVSTCFSKILATGTLQTCLEIFFELCSKKYAWKHRKLALEWPQTCLVNRWETISFVKMVFESGPFWSIVRLTSFDFPVILFIGFCTELLGLSFEKTFKSKLWKFREIFTKYWEGHSFWAIRYLLSFRIRIRANDKHQSEHQVNVLLLQPLSFSNN
jgi:hypothetical protein